MLTIKHGALSIEQFDVAATHLLVHGSQPRRYALFGRAFITSVWSLCEKEVLLT
jgi:hypothetical protein